MVMMKGAEHGKRDDSSARSVRIVLTRSRYTLTKPLMRSCGVESRNRVLPQDVFEVRLAQDEYVIEALTPHTIEEALAHCVHVRCANGSLTHAHADSVRHPVEVGTELRATVADENLGAFFEGHHLAESLRSPLLVLGLSSRRRARRARRARLR